MATRGAYTCPMVILAPSGGYLGCGGPWHSQTNEAWFTHAPGLKVAMPSTPAEAAEMIASAAHGDDPTLILLPKYLFFKKCKLTDPVPLHIDQSRVRRSGKDMSLLAWGNTVDLALEAAEDAQNAGIDVEVIDIRFLAPFDPSVALASVAKQAGCWWFRRITARRVSGSP